MIDTFLQIKDIITKYAEDIPPHKYIFFICEFTKNDRVPQLYKLPNIHKTRKIGNSGSDQWSPNVVVLLKLLLDGLTQN